MKEENFIQVTPVIRHDVRALCTQKYPGHPKGCPNFGAKEGCPPFAPLYDETYDLSKPIYAIYNRFDLGAHVERMKTLHPNWSDRQLVCCLYWQTTARNQLKSHIREFFAWTLSQGARNYHVTTCPEAMGVDVTSTMRSAGIILEWPPKKYAYQVALAGIKIWEDFRQWKSGN